MAQIISFVKKQRATEEANRWKAIAKGQIAVYICDVCGERFEVMDDDYPDACPGCGRTFTKFKENT